MRLSGREGCSLWGARVAQIAEFQPFRKFSRALQFSPAFPALESSSHTRSLEERHATEHSNNCHIGFVRNFGNFAEYAASAGKLRNHSGGRKCSKSRGHDYRWPW